MAKIYLAGRLVVVLSVMASAFLLYLLGKMMYGRETGLFASLLFVISPGVVASTHIMKPHLFGVCFVLLFLIFTLKIKESGARSSYILAGLFLGLAAGSAVYLAIFFIHLLTCHLLRFSGRGIREYFRSLRDSSFLLALCSVLLAFLITNPYYLLSWKEVLYERSYDLKLFSFALSSENLSNFAFSFFYTVHGIPLTLLVFVGLFYALARGREYWFLPLLPIFYFLIASAVIGKGTPPNFRFALALIPFSALLAGLAAYRLWSLRKRWIHFILIGVMAFTLSHALLYSFNFQQDTSSGSTFIRSGEWINQNIPRGSSIGLLHLFTPATTPPFDFRRYRITVYTPHDLSSGKRYLSQYFISDSRIDDFLVPHYQLIESFRPVIPISTMRFKDHFAGANRPVFVYKRML
jgi:4-amino-4-deoxy-L-arabinose transferase-like glycosyltransferase